MPERSTRRLVLLALLVATGGHRAAAGASCAGSCATEFAADPKAVEAYVKQTSAALSRCLKSGSPRCPTACGLPDPAAFGIGQACAALVQCEVRDVAATAAGDAWDASGACVTSRPGKCDLQRLKHASTLTIRGVTAVRKGQSGKLARLSTRCQRHGCPGADAACGAAMGLAQALMESLYAACDAVPLTEDEMNAAAQKAIRDLASRGMRITPDAWSDETKLLALVAQTFTETGCLGRVRPMAATDHPVGALDDGQTVYCGPGSCTKGAAGCRLPDPGACLNTVCAIHDGCYGQIQTSACVRRDCTWSSQTVSCDADFFAEAGVCWGLGQCGFTCKAVIAAATAITAMNFQFEHDGSPCPRRVGECPTCPGRCQDDCTCALVETTTTTTLPSTCEFHCADGSCIAAAVVCNGVSDCPGGDDEDPATCFDQHNCCVATRGCPGETGSSCASTCCCCPYQEACCPDWSGCCASP